MIALLATLGMCATYKGELQVKLDMPEKTYISPLNQDRVKDELVVPVQVPPAYKEMAIGAYRFRILDNLDQPVRTIHAGDVRAQQEIKGKKEKIAIPENLRWDGRDDADAYAKDGEYTYVIEAWDMEGNKGQSVPLVVVVDNTPPFVELSSRYKSFSPNGDGRSDTLPIGQNRSSTEELWTGEFRDSLKQVVKRLSWEGEAKDLTWDGKDQSGRPLPDGSYAYRVGSTDLAGNKASFELGPFTIDTKSKSVILDIEYAVFSPNGDGVKDTLVFLPKLEVRENVESWKSTVYDQQGTARRVISGEGAPPVSRLEFDGRDDAGNTLEDGKYTAELGIVYTNGDNPEAVSPEFFIDTKIPEATLTPEYTLFSPDGDGYRDVVTVKQSSSEEELWGGVVKDASGRVVVRRSWKGKASDFTWDGKDDQGKALADGRYTYTLSSTDAAGNVGEHTVEPIIIDTRPTSLSLSVEHASFSPNGDGKKDFNSILPKIGLREGIESWTLEVKDQGDVTRREITGRAAPPESIRFDGKDNNGRTLPDGMYRGALTAFYEKGNKPLAASPAFGIDTTAPQINLSSEYLLFSPDGDGRRDILPVRQRSTNEDLWEGIILDATGRAVRRYAWKGQASDFAWDGKDDKGKIGAEGIYLYRISAIDRAENSVSAEIKGIQLDTKPTSVTIKAAFDRFSPNNDGFRDDMPLDLSVRLAERIRSWKVDILDARGEARRTYSGMQKVPGRLTWDGKDERGRVEEGSYSSSFTVEYEKGAVAAAKTSSFVVDVTAPRVNIALSPQPFSPDDDGEDDTLTISLEVSDSSPIEDWSARIQDPTGQPFKEFSGIGVPPRTIAWNGRSTKGELVQSADDYPIVVNVKDDVGNAASVKRSISVDVLVIQEDDRLKIIISSIYFKPYTADYTDVPADRAERNLKTLERLTQILTKFGEYRIRLEGHAVREYWDIPKRAQREEAEELLPLSQARAGAIRSALIDRGIEADRMATEGYGGTRPVVPHSDLINRWKNRRVEFILLKPPE